MKRERQRYNITEDTSKTPKHDSDLTAPSFRKKDR